ncbi:hypothetical protein N2152v2_007785 [Parachlorella kessleri]
MQAMRGKESVHLLLEDLDFNQPGWLEQLLQVITGLQGPRRVNISLQSCRLVFKRAELDLGTFTIPAGMRYSIMLRDSIVTLNRVLLRGSVKAEGKVALDFNIKGNAPGLSASVVHNRIVTEKGSRMGPFPKLATQLRVVDTSIDDNSRCPQQQNKAANHGTSNIWLPLFWGL